jgi:hypothetical protein
MAKLTKLTKVQIAIDVEDGKTTTAGIFNLLLPGNIEKNFFNIADVSDETKNKIDRYDFLTKKLDKGYANSDEFDEYETLKPEIDAINATEIKDEQYSAWFAKNIKGDTKAYIETGKANGYTMNQLFTGVISAYLEKAKKGN